jgi:hypothetical protein
MDPVVAGPPILNDIDIRLPGALLSRDLITGIDYQAPVYRGVGEVVIPVEIVPTRVLRTIEVVPRVRVQDYQGKRLGKVLLTQHDAAAPVRFVPGAITGPVRTDVRIPLPPGVYAIGIDAWPVRPTVNDAFGGTGVVAIVE